MQTKNFQVTTHFSQALPDHHFYPLNINIQSFQNTQTQMNLSNYTCFQEQTKIQIQIQIQIQREIQVQILALIWIVCKMKHVPCPFKYPPHTFCALPILSFFLFTKCEKSTTSQNEKESTSLKHFRRAPARRSQRTRGYVRWILYLSISSTLRGTAL